jgi:hypothetical protein
MVESIGFRLHFFITLKTYLDLNDLVNLRKDKFRSTH